ncbi:alpha/beta fold hydrolase [Parapedobacter tibetensis]|uniref:alpha/beta fold hydrolase n=1 Tax=Parapedobacter tibetensis TaxID=2972951 RepID=UPI00214D89CD|nr:alpha/beta hydrolase [Parapedobacter tibetensis]
MFLNKIIGLLLVLPTFIFAQQVKIPDGWSDGYAYANGIRIHYYRAVPQPDKPVMVMVHGVTDNGLCWTTLALKLQDTYDIYMLDARGHGLSDPFTSSDNGETLVKDVVEFVKAMEFSNPILMGHSMGAATVMRVGAEYPEVGRAIIMLDPLLRARTGGPGVTARNSANRNPQPESRPQSGTSNNRLSVSMFGSPETLVAQNNYSFEELVVLGRRQNPLWDEMDIAYWALSKKQYHGPYTSEAAQAMSGTMNIGNSLAKIQVPAIILKADASPEVRKTNEAAAAVMPNGKLVHIDGGGHNLHHDKLERTTQVLQEFLSTL